VKLIKRYPFLTYGLIALLVYTFVLVSGVQYDDGSLGGLLIVSSPFWAVIYWVPSEIIFMINQGAAIKGHQVFSIIIGLVLCLLADYLLNLYKGRNGGKLVNT